MKGKLLLGLALTSLASTGFAMEITKGKLVKHTEWKTGSGAIKIAFFDKKKSLHAEALKFKSKNFKEPLPSLYDMITVMDEMEDAEGIVGEETTIEGDSNVSISNRTDASQTYTINTYICAFNFSDGFGACGVSEDIVTLDAGGYSDFGRLPMLTFTPNTPGMYGTFVTTGVVKENQTTYYSSFADKYLEVSEAKKA